MATRIEGSWAGRAAGIVAGTLTIATLGCGPGRGSGSSSGAGAPCTVDEDCGDAGLCIYDPADDTSYCSGGDEGGTMGTTGASTSDGMSTTDGPGPDDIPDPEPILGNDVDILFVIDNSGSMGEEQAKLTPYAQALAERLDTAGLDYHLGFTTSDNGNVECSGTSPEGGQLRLLPCTYRADEFTWPKVNPTVMAYDTACAAHCPAAVADAIEWYASDVAGSNTAELRPWIQRVEGVANVGGASVGEIVGCMAPQGVDGCGFEQQLESMFKSVERSRDPSDAMFGFFREDSVKAVVILTDEADCSANEAHQAAVFDRNLPEAQKVFWADPTSTIPTSAICWNAGVVCIGDPSGYDTCMSRDYDVMGNQITAQEAVSDAVLRPVSRYRGILEQLETTSQAINASNEVIVTVIGGVPEGYGTGNVPLVYAESTNLTTEQNFGIEFGCASTDVVGTAVPPVRIRELAEAMSTRPPGEGRNLYSVCAPAYENAIEGVLDDLGRALNRDDL